MEKKINFKLCLIPRAKHEPTMYLNNCLGELILKVLSERENTEDSKRKRGSPPVTSKNTKHTNRNTM
jgi:hypothetical protein